MESFFKNRFVIARSNPLNETLSSDSNACALPHLDKKPELSCADDEATASTSENILDAEAEGYKVEVIKEHDIVTQLRITCACGKQFTLNCQYPPPVDEPST